MWRELGLEVKANFPPAQSANKGRVVTKSQLFQDPSNNNESSGNNKQSEMTSYMEDRFCQSLCVFNIWNFPYLFYKKYFKFPNF